MQKKNIRIKRLKSYCVCHLHRVYRLHERLVNLRSDYNLRLKSVSTTSHVTMTKTSQQTTMKVRPELDDVTLRYVQDLLAWVQENQHRIDEAQWGSDLPSVESQLGSHRGLHQTVEDFRSKIERAKADEVGLISGLLQKMIWSTVVPLMFKVISVEFCHICQTQLSPVSKGAYKEYLGKLDLQYGKLLVNIFLFQTFIMDVKDLNCNKIFVSTIGGFSSFRPLPSPALETWIHSTASSALPPRN